MTDEFSVKVLVFSASLREHSLNDRLATLAAQSVEAHGATVDRGFMADFDCPSYDGDEEREGQMPEGAVRLRDRLIGSDGFILVSPEYNASMPGILKNVIDWTSRFKPQPFTRRYGMLMSASPSMVGGNRGLWSLRIPLEHLGARIFPDMFSLAQAHKAFGENGGIADWLLAKRFEENLRAFLDLVEAAKHYPCIKKAWVEFLGEPGDTVGRVEAA
jgi:chromate reductase